jgi:hypothetical protein
MQCKTNTLCAPKAARARVCVSMRMWPFFSLLSTNNTYNIGGKKGWFHLKLVFDSFQNLFCTLNNQLHFLYVKEL